MQGRHEYHHGPRGPAAQPVSAVTVAGARGVEQQHPPDDRDAFPLMRVSVRARAWACSCEGHAHGPGGGLGWRLEAELGASTGQPAGSSQARQG